MAKKNYKISDFIGRYKSRHICESCGAVLYNANGPMKGLYCLTSDCDKSLPAHFKVDASSHSETSRLFSDLNKERADISAALQRWDRGFLVRELASGRNGLFEAWHATGRANIHNLLAVEKLLLLVNQVQPTGTHRHPNDLIRLVEQASKLNNSESIVENLQLEREVVVKSRVMAQENDGFFALDLAYVRAFHSDQKASGLVSGNSISQQEIEKAFLYADIDFYDYGIEVDNTATDDVKTFESVAPIGIQLGLIYNSHLWSSQMHKHGHNPFAVKVLHDWFLRCPSSGTECLNDDPNIEQMLDISLQSVSGSDYSGADFIAEYIESEDLVPYAPKHPDGLLLYRMTLLLMCVYLYVQDVPVEFRGLLGHSGFQNLFSTRRGRRFTNWIAERLEPLGYSCPIIDKKFKFGGVEREFDLVAVNETERKILLIEAKYKDMPVKSLNSKLLVPNELEGKKGMLYELVRQNERKDLFVADPKRMAVECELESPFDEYAVQAFVVSKSSPILDSLDDVRWLRADKFLELIEE